MSQYRIIVIHGTNASEKNDIGEEWWQQGSEFYNEIIKHLDLDEYSLDWVCYPWSGANSEKERKIEAGKLNDLLENLEKRNPAKTLIIGHSHGGSIIYKCLRARLISSPPNKYFPYSITVGTPYVSRNFLDLGALLRLLQTSILMFFISAFLYAMYRWGGGPDVYWFLANVCLFLTLSIPLIGVIGSTAERYSESISTIFWRNTIKIKRKMLGDSSEVREYDYDLSNYTMRIYSIYDEVINALESAPNQTVNIASPKMVRVPVFAVLSLLLLLLVTLYRAEFWDYGASSSFTRSIGNHIIREYNVSVNIEILEFVFYIEKVFSMLILCIVITFFPLSQLISRTVNVVFRRSLVSEAFGDDLSRFFASALTYAGPNPPNPHTKYDWKGVPREIDKEIEQVTGKNASETLKRARRALRISAAGKRHDGILDSISRSISWSEIVHTSYFQVKSISNMIAWYAIDKAKFPSAQVLTEEEVEKCREIYDYICPGTLTDSNKAKSILHLIRRSGRNKN